MRSLRYIRDGRSAGWPMLPASNLSLIQAVSFVSLSLGDENRNLFVGQYKVKENSALGRFRDTLSMT